MLPWPIVDDGGRLDIDPGKSEVSVLPEVDVVLECTLGLLGGRVEVNEDDKGPSLEPMAGLKPLVVSPPLSMLELPAWPAVALAAGTVAAFRAVDVLVLLIVGPRVLALDEGEKLEVSVE